MKRTPVELTDRLERALSLLSPCRVCPRACGADRLRDEQGECRIGRLARVSSFDLHFGEEPPISGVRGSGTVFFSGCSLRCAFCQNFPVSQLAEGRETTPRELADMMLRLQEAGAHNLNLVTPTHVVPQILEALALAAPAGFRLPIVYNSSGYDSPEALRILDGIVDIYMPDAKYGDDASAFRFSGVPHYVETNQAALLEMHRQTGAFRTDAEGIARSGVLIRHLVLPGGAAGSRNVLEFIRDRLPGAALALMSQYHPSYRAHEFPGMDRRITREEYEEVLETALEFGLVLGHVQGME